ncbi:Glycerol-3-phosphate dehydrogenase [Shimia gijangensis]|uniref:Glycerol-3-phosphate dehydrogenase n=1 Tax=Shimia gijangensis TaxID=1470563 RepID=A0A1M6N219_9RHOB|nr:FAD-dependent oxidoreductase [Shimia gijangensis]SHJ89724.1 Glycerol-3-phosphate dehydrogenase [Shimia gijangensis]
MNMQSKALKRPDLADLDGQSYDVAVIGGGINGAGTAQSLAAKGYSVLLVEAQDFASGASSRSAKMMHFGLRYLDRGEPIWNYIKNPAWFILQCKRARDTMRHRAELVRDMPERLIPYTMYVPIYKEDFVAPWQIEMGLRLMNAISRCSTPAEWRRLSRSEMDTTPFVADARDRDQLQAVFAITEHRYDWPERLVADYMLDAVRMGAVCRNYTRLNKMERAKEGDIALTLEDAETNAIVSVRAKRVVNTAGAWIDLVLGDSGLNATRQIAATKGAHAVIQLPEKYKGQSFAHFTTGRYPFYFLPMRDHHVIGASETPFEGNPSDVRVTDEDLDWLVFEANRMLPGIPLSRDDVLYSWAGVRPMPHIEGYTGKQNLLPEYNTHDSDGYPDVLSVPGGALMTHRFTGRKAAEIATKGLRPSRAPQTPDLRSRQPRENTNSPPLFESDPSVRLSHLEDLAREEMPVALADILLRRSGALWSGELNSETVSKAAEAVAGAMQWSDDEKQKQIEHCLEQLETHHLISTNP